MPKLFGWSLQRTKPDTSVISPIAGTALFSKDGAAVISASGVVAHPFMLDPTQAIIDEVNLINTVRGMSLQAECSEAIDSIVDEAVIIDEETNEILQLDLTKTDFSESTKNQIQDEFTYVLQLLDFKKTAHNLFRQWYVDGRMFFQVTIDEQKPTDGIQSILPIDPRTIKKVCEFDINYDQQTGTQIIRNQHEYFVYNPLGVSSMPAYMASGTSMGVGTNGTKIAADSIVYIHSGLFDTSHTVVLSYLYKAIKPLNQLVNIEDASVIYRISRAPERRVFYIDVGNLPVQRAEEYLKNIVAKFKSQLSYDSRTGEMAAQTRFSTMLEDFYLPRREGGKGTEITTLPAGTGLGSTDEILYFMRKLYRSLSIPSSRIEPASGTNNGGPGGASRSSEITRDEVKFGRFLSRLRLQFSDLFVQLLRRQLLLKSILDISEWEHCKNEMIVRFPTNNYFSELKDLEIVERRFQVATAADALVQKYISRNYVEKHILKLTEEQLKEIEEANEQDEDTQPGKVFGPPDPEAELDRLNADDAGGLNPDDPETDDEADERPTPKDRKGNRFGKTKPEPSEKSDPDEDANEAKDADSSKKKPNPFRKSK